MHIQRKFFSLSFLDPSWRKGASTLVSNSLFLLLIGVHFPGFCEPLFLFECVWFLCGFGWFQLWVFGCGRAESGSETFKAGDLLVNKEGVRVVSEKEVEAVKFFSLAFYVLHFISFFFGKCVYSIGLVSCFSFGFDLLILMKCFLWQEGVPEFLLFHKMGHFLFRRRERFGVCPL